MTTTAAMSILDRIAQQQGWNVDSQLELVLEFIDTHSYGLYSFENFLQRVANNENECIKREEPKITTKFINISDRYGEQVPVTIEDYQELNPDGKFMESWRYEDLQEYNVILEWVGGDIRKMEGDWEVIAKESIE